MRSGHRRGDDGERDDRQRYRDGRADPCGGAGRSGASASVFIGPDLPAGAGARPTSAHSGENNGVLPLRNPLAALDAISGPAQLWPCLLVFSSAAAVRCAEPFSLPATRTRHCPFSPPAFSPTACRAREHSPHPRCRDDARAARRSRRDRRMDRAQRRSDRCPSGAAQAARSRALLEDPRLDPARRAAPRPVRDGDPPAARW